MELLNEGQEHVLDLVHRVELVVVILSTQDLGGVDSAGIPANVSHGEEWMGR